jgi:hypothetical protein
MNKIINNLSHIGDLFAIPFFLLLTYYFYSLPEKSTLEYVLFLFSIAGFLMDVLFTCSFLLT